MAKIGRRPVVHSAVRSAAILGASFLWMACLFPTSTTEGGFTRVDGCTTDSECSATTSCTEAHCVNRQCQVTNLPAGATVASTYGLTCHRAVCDGHGAETTIVDPTVVPTGNAVACKHAACDANGNLVTEPDPSNVPEDTPHDCKRDGCDTSGARTTTPDPTDTPADHPGDCKRDACDANGGFTQSANPSDTPADQAGDCQRDGCDANGNPNKTPDNTDVPPPSTCMTFTCQSGKAVGAPANIGKKCTDSGFACGTTGQCDTCPAPDAACTDQGYGAGARSITTAHDFAGIGHCDSGGRVTCDTVKAGEVAWFTYYDDGTGFLCDFDPYFEVRPTAPATMCAYFACPSVQCPGGSRPDNSIAGKPGCCVDAPANGFTGMAVGFCSGARVTIKVQGTAACTGYEMHFKD